MNSETTTPTDQFSRIIADTLPWLAMISLLAAASTSFLKVFAGTLDANSEIFALLYAAPWAITVFLWGWKGRLFAIGGVVVSGAISLTPVAGFHSGFEIAPLVSLWILAVVALAISKEQVDVDSKIVRGSLVIAAAWAVVTIIFAYIVLKTGVSHSGRGTLTSYTANGFLSPTAQIGLFSLAGMVTGVVYLFIRPSISMAIAFVTGIPVVVSVLSGYASIMYHSGLGAYPLWLVLQSLIGGPLVSVAIGAGAVLAMGRNPTNTERKAVKLDE